MPSEVSRRYRFDPVGVMHITLLQVLVFLRFVACGSFQLVVGDILHVSQASCSKYIQAVARALAAHHKRFIRFPSGRKAILTKSAFFEKAGK